MNDQYVTKDYLDQALHGLEGRMDAKLDSLKQELMEFTRGLQTEMLRGFEGYARGVDIRLRNLEVNTTNDSSAIKQRVAELETRMLELEKKFMQRPPQV